MKYRPEIDGLRAIAVIPVILFHAGFEYFSGGFVGVDVFFVISGYLITTILIEDIENKRFSIVNFYVRRARRILPALTVVTLLTIPIAWLLLSDSSLQKFGNALIGVSTFTSNVVFWKQQGYFNESAELNPLLHTWSLAVEEQYYILFPLFLILAWRFSKNTAFWMIVVITAISFSLSEWGWRNKEMANFYLAPTRAWELLLGSVTAFIVQKRGVRTNNLLASIGITAIIFAVFSYDKTIPFPSVFALVPVLGAVLIILYAKQGTYVANLLSTKHLVGVGLISYSAYLCHQPIFAFSRVIIGDVDIGIQLSLVLIFATFFLAYLSWRYIEKPFRNRSFLITKSIFILSFLSLLFLLFLGLASKHAVSNYEHRLAQQLSENEFIYFENMDDRKFIEGRLSFPLNDVNHIVVGSSRVMQINSEMIGEPILNLAVSGASIEDDIAISLEAVAKLNAKNIYIAADPWLLNINDNQVSYKSINNLYEYWFERAKKNLPLKQFMPSLDKAAVHSRNNNSFVNLRDKLYKFKNSMPTNKSKENIAKKAHDGSHIYDKKTGTQNLNLSDDFPYLLKYQMEDFEYDNIAEEKLLLLINYLKQNNVKVILILAPYHPELYELMKLDKPIFVAIENKFREFASNHNIKIVGSYDASKIGSKADEFYDGMHPKAKCMNRIFQNLKL